MSDIERPSSAPQENNEHDAQIEAVRAQLQDLQEAIQARTEKDPQQMEQPIRTAVDAMATSIQNAIDAGVDADDLVALANTQIELENDALEQQTESIFKEVVDQRGELDGLTSAVSAATETTPPQEEENSIVGMVAGGMTSALDIARSHISNMEDGKPKQLLFKILDGLSGSIVGMVEKVAASPIAGFLIDDVDIIDIANLRLDVEEKALAAFPELRTTYDSDKNAYKEQWMLAYRNWFKAGQKGEMPTLVNTINGTSLATPQSSPEQESTAPELFAADEVRKNIADGKEVAVTLAGDKKLMLQKDKIIAQLPNTATRTVKLSTGSTALQIESLGRVSTDMVNPADYTVLLSNNAGEVKMSAVLTAIEAASGDDPVSITGTSISVTKTI